MRSEAVFEAIGKEEVADCHFPHYDVITSSDERQSRRAALEKGMLLGNGEHAKVKIFFETNHGPRVVETTIWEADDEEITLKAGTFIPIHAIYKVEF